MLDLSVVASHDKEITSEMLYFYSLSLRNGTTVRHTATPRKGLNNRVLMTLMSLLVDEVCLPADGYFLDQKSTQYDWRSPSASSCRRSAHIGRKSETRRSQNHTPRSTRYWVSDHC